MQLRRFPGLYSFTEEDVAAALHAFAVSRIDALLGRLASPEVVEEAARAEHDYMAKRNTHFNVTSWVELKEQTRHRLMLDMRAALTAAASKLQEPQP